VAFPPPLSFSHFLSFFLLQICSPVQSLTLGVPYFTTNQHTSSSTSTSRAMRLPTNTPGTKIQIPDTYQLVNNLYNFTVVPGTHAVSSYWRPVRVDLGMQVLFYFYNCQSLKLKCLDSSKIE
jgi:hypothetical protein